MKNDPKDVLKIKLSEQLNKAHISDIKLSVGPVKHICPYNIELSLHKVTYYGNVYIRVDNFPGIGLKAI